ncbi:MAG TPA: glycosyltransferase family 39 protein [Membranihabitans sp.]|nr:glycosyltransferase family 39 protein [Membranihabitans sp.]
MRYRTKILLAFILLKFLLQIFLLSPEYELHRDEFLYLDQANHLAWGYLSVPPLISWTSYLIHILGNSVFWIKFFPALYGAGTIYLVWKAIEALDGTVFALILGTVCVLLSALLRLNTLYQPNSMDVLCWTAVYFCLLKFLKSNDNFWLYSAAVGFAIGLLNKYNIAFLALGLIPIIFLTRERKVFSQARIFWAAGLSMVITAPNIIWQVWEDFPVFHHLNQLAQTQLIHVDRWDFLKMQPIFYPGGMLVVLVALYALVRFPNFNCYRLFFWSFWFTLAIFLYFRAKDYYAIGIYPIYIAFGSAYLGHILSAGWRRYLQPAVIGIPILLFIPMFQVAFPNRSPEYITRHQNIYEKLGLLRWEDGNNHQIPQDFADMLGWKELASKVDSVYSIVEGYTLVLCDNYGQAGAINFYSRQNVRAVSFEADYLNWFDLSIPYDNLIRIKSRRNAEEEFDETSPFFQNSARAGIVTHPFAREHGTTIFLFEGARIDIRERIQVEINEKRNR